ncbi:epithelial-stromal interaction protein 1 isoform X2 [Hypanus sabinus]|uniref:epithelial-stromal interaction protein 1 isoform X2 n=1 Tax=Hypanus sabinus TaxID=79690 RepID=UPI0028C3B895|nr:epithelial-stromal interaction protein 1 isoform X2 [Hypanus sabinus]
MSHNRRLYTSHLGQPGGMKPHSEFTDQPDDPGATGLENPKLRTDPNTTEAEPGQLRYQGGYSVMAPNQSKRSQIQQMANKELEELRQWKEAHKPGPINMTPTQLGGLTSEHEVRRKQQINLLGSKIQQRAKKEEYDRKRREAEELQYQKVKEVQREKANKLAERRRREDAQRKAQLQAQHYQANQEFLNRIGANRSSSQQSLRPSSAVSTTSWAKTHTYKEHQKQAEDQKLQEMKNEQRRKSEYLAERESEEEAEQLKRLHEDRRRKNNAFLDNLERRGQSSQNSNLMSLHVPDEQTFGQDTKEYVTASKYYGDVQEEENLCDTLAESEISRSSPEDTKPDWDLMKLSSFFPDYELTILEEFLQQCDGEFARVIELLQ